MSKFQRDIKFEPGHNKGGNYGINAMKIRFILHGEKASVQFLMNTGWYPKKEEGRFGPEWYTQSPGAWDLGYHADEPQYENHDSYDCDNRSSGKCYYDGSSLYAEPILEAFFLEGEEAVWNKLENYYNELFNKETL